MLLRENEDGRSRAGSVWLAFLGVHLDDFGAHLVAINRCAHHFHLMHNIVPVVFPFENNSFVATQFGRSWFRV